MESTNLEIVYHNRCYRDNELCNLAVAVSAYHLGGNTDCLGVSWGNGAPGQKT